MPVLLIGFALAVVLATFPGLRERRVKGRSWVFLRALFPSWRFFEELGEVPGLKFRMVQDGDADRGWTECFASEPRRARMLFLNSRGNLRLAANSLIEQLTDDLSEMPDGTESEIINSVSYALVTRLVRFRIREMGRARPGEHFQFKVVSAVLGKESVAEDIMISAAHEV